MQYRLVKPLQLQRQMPESAGQASHKLPTCLGRFNDSADLVLCAQTLQFVKEKEAGLSEVRRIVKFNGRVAVSLWCDMEENPYFYTLVETITRHIGPETATGLKSAFAFSEAKSIHTLFEKAAFRQIDMSVTQLNLSLPKLTEFVPSHISATPMVVGFNNASQATQQQVVKDVAEKLSEYKTNSHVQVPFKTHMIIAEN